jgi:plasmid stabilization system protein ParE
MAKHKIVWSNKAKFKLLSILEFYTDRNKSSAYSRKLYKKISKELVLLKKQPEIGIKTDLEGVRGLIVDDFILFYEVYPGIIVIHTLWDCRQNPDLLRIR